MNALTKTKKKQSLQEMAESKGKQLLIEESWLSYDPKKVEFFEKSVLTETKASEYDNLFCEAVSEKYEAFAILRDVDVSKFTENLNERIYNKPLWEQVRDNKVAEGTLMLADHPTDEGSVKSICGVWHNFRVLEDRCIADLYIVGSHSHGMTLYETAKAGGKIGTSTVGFGEFLEDNKTVNPISYELVRTGDWVLDPSQGTYAGHQNISEQKEKKEKTSESTQIQKENKGSLLQTFTNNTEGNANILNENEDFRMSTQLLEKTLKDQQELTEANFKNQVDVRIKAAKKNVDLLEAIDDLKGLKETIPAKYPALGQRVEKMVDSLTEKLDKEIQMQKKNLGETNENLKSLEEKYEIANKSLEVLKERHKKAIEIIEKWKSTSSNNEGIMLKDITDMEEDIKVLLKDRADMQDDINIFVEDQEAMQDDLNILGDDHKIMQGNIDQFLEDRYNMQKDLDYYTENTDLLEQEKEDKEEEEEEEEKKEKEKKENYRRRNFRSRRYIEQENGKTKEEEEEEEDEEKKKEDQKESFLRQRQMLRNRQSAPRNRSRIREQYRDPVDDLYPSNANYQYPADFESGYDEELLKPGFESRKPKTSLREKNYNKNSIKEAIKTFYENEVSKYAALEDVEKEILNSKSLIEAIRKVEVFVKDHAEMPITLHERVEHEDEDWLGDRY